MRASALAALAICTPWQALAANCFSNVPMTCARTPADDGLVRPAGPYSPDYAVPLTASQIILSGQGRFQATADSTLAVGTGDNIRNRGAKLLLAGTSADRLVLTNPTGDNGSAAIYSQNTAALTWGEYVDINLTSFDGARGIYGLSLGKSAMQNVRIDQSQKGKTHIVVVAEYGGSMYFDDSLLVLNGEQSYAFGIFAWRTSTAYATDSMISMLGNPTVVGEYVANMSAESGSNVRVDRSMMYARGSHAVIALANQANTKLYLNGSTVAAGIRLGAKAQPTDTPNWNVYGRPVDAADAPVSGPAGYVATAATQTYAALATGSGAVYIDRDRNNTPTSIVMAGASQNDALYSQALGTVYSRDAIIETRAPQSNGARADSTGALVLTGNQITTLADQSNGIVLQGSGTSLSAGAAPTANTIVTRGAASHAMRAEGGAKLALDGSTNLVPAAGSNVSGVGSAVLSASGAGSEVNVSSAASALLIGMTQDTTGVNNFGALADGGGKLAFAAGASTGGTALMATTGGTLVFAGAGATGAGSHTVVDTASFLGIAGATTPVAIGSLAGAGTTTLGASELVTGVGTGSVQADTVYSGVLTGAGGMLTHDGARMRLTLTGTANNYSGTTTVKQGSLRAGATQAYSAASPHVTLANGLLDLDGFSQTVASLTNAGMTRLMQTGSGLPTKATQIPPSTTITTTGDYVSQGGSLVIGTELGTDGSPSDKMVVNGNVVNTSPTVINLTNVGGAGALTTGKGILVVQVNGADSPAGAFVLAAPAQAGGFTYTLVRDDDKSWYLRSIATPKPPEPAGKVAVVPVMGIPGLAALAALLAGGAGFITRRRRKG